MYKCLNLFCKFCFISKFQPCNPCLAIHLIASNPILLLPYLLLWTYWIKFKYLMNRTIIMYRSIWCNHMHIDYIMKEHYPWERSLERLRFNLFSLLMMTVALVCWLDQQRNRTLRKDRLINWRSLSQLTYLVGFLLVD